jgi:hypothetical protein
MVDLGLGGPGMIREATVKKIVAIVHEAYGIRIKLYPWKKMEDQDAAGQADLVNEVVIVADGPWTTRDQLASYLLHECAHILCKREGRYPVFHSTVHPKYLTDKQILAEMSTAWKAEKYVEQRARDMFSELFPGGIYHFSYGWRELEKDWFNQHCLDDHRKELRRRKLRRIDKEMRKKGCKV